MANTGYISSSGIDQRFTTGPYSGSIVTSSYSSGSTLLGPTITFYQSFISGTIDDIVVCNSLFERYYYDPISCPLGDCLPPIALSVTPASCETQTYQYSFLFDSGSTSADYSTIEYSTITDFSSNTGSVFVTNSVGYTNPIDISNLELLPPLSSPVYFRVFNSCSISGTSSYSNIISASCRLAPPPSTSPFTVRLKNNMGGTLFYTLNSTEYSLFNTNNIDLTINDLNPLNFTFRTLQPGSNSFPIFVSGSSSTFNGYVSTNLSDPTPDSNGNPVYQSINNYPSTLYFNTEGTPDASIEVDRSLWNGSGLLELDFSSLSIPNEENPWYSEESGIGGF